MTRPKRCPRQYPPAREFSCLMTHLTGIDVAVALSWANLQ
jgi:hypothetical protein